MDRYEISPEAQAIIDDFRTTNNVQPTDVVLPDSNLVVDDHIEVDNSWKIVVLKGGQDGSLDCLMLEWGNMVLQNFDLVAFISDRKGPDGQTMPIFDEQQLAARTAAKTPAVEADAQKGRHRSLQDALRDAVKALPKDQEKAARAKLKQLGILKGDHA